MSTTTFPVTLPVTRSRPRLVKAASDTMAITWRNLLMLQRVPQLIVFSTIQPVLFVLMFRYVFGGAIHVPGVRYVDYLMPGIFALSWMFALIGLATRDPESAQAASFPILAPLVFASSAFVPLASMPGWLQAFAAHQPVTITVNAVRALVLGGATLRPVLEMLAWSVGMVAVFAPLAVARYRRAT